MKRIVIALISYYQALKPVRVALLSLMGVPQRSCIYTPTCSAYTKTAIQRYGVFKGALMGFKRFLRCRPGVKGGYDPVP